MENVNAAVQLLAVAGEITTQVLAEHHQKLELLKEVALLEARGAQEIIKAVGELTDLVEFLLARVDDLEKRLDTGV